MEHASPMTQPTASYKKAPFQGAFLLPRDSWSSNPWVRTEHGAAVRQMRAARGSEAAGQSHPLRLGSDVMCSNIEFQSFLLL